MVKGATVQEVVGARAGGGVVGKELHHQKVEDKQREENVATVGRKVRYKKSQVKKNESEDF